MPTDGRRVSFREDKSRSGSSRSSTLKSDSGAGSSSTGSSYSGTAYPDRYTGDPLYEISALKEALTDALKNGDQWKDKAFDVEQKYRKELGEAKSRAKGLEDHCAAIEDDKKQLQREKTTLKDENKSLKDENRSLKDENRSLKDENRSLKDENRTFKDENKSLKGEIEALRKKLDKLKKKDEKQPASASPPESNKLHRSGSKHSKDSSDSDKEKSRLKERFVPRNENSSETNSSNQSNSKTIRGRRMSSASYADRTVYIEPYGQSAPRPSVTIPQSPMTSGGRRLDGYAATSKTGYPAISTLQEPVYSSTPRSAADRPSVIYQYPDAPLSPHNHSYEDGNYHAYPLPPRR